MGAVFLSKHTLWVGFLVYNPKQIHSAVADIAKHIHTLKLAEPFCNGSETLRIDFRHNDFYVVIFISKSKRHLTVLKQILLKL